MTSTVQGPAEPAPCEWCGLLHVRDAVTPNLCPYVRAFEFRCDEAGKRYISRVEFLTPADYAAHKAPEKIDTAEKDYPRLGPSGGR